MEELIRYFLSYDAGCIAAIRLIMRWLKWHPNKVALAEKIVMLLPKMHMLSHRERCHIIYALAYTWGTGLVSGETVEHPWAEHNQAGLSTREMSPGARHDALNDFHNFWNWEKVRNMTSFLTRKMNEAFEGQERTTLYFQGLTQEQPASRIAEWEKRLPPIGSRGGTVRSDNSIDSVYILDSNAVPSTGKAYTDLLKLEIMPKGTMATEAATHMPGGTAAMLKVALEIDNMQFRILEHATHPDLDADSDSDDNSLDSKRESLQNALESLRDMQQDLTPKLVDNLATAHQDDRETEETESRPELEPLGLPSDFSAEDRVKYGLDSLAIHEGNIRLGRAYDLLVAVREAVRHKGSVYQSKLEAHGQKDSTRAQKLVSDAVERCKRLARQYNRNFETLLSLKGPDKIVLPSLPANIETTTIPSQRSATLAGHKTKSTPARGQKKTSTKQKQTYPMTCCGLQRMDLNKDLVAKDLTRARQLGDSKYSASWIWRTPIPQGATQKDVEAWEIESSRVSWFRAKAEVDRYNEFVNQVHADFRATIASYKKMAEYWANAGNTEDLFRGARAYAKQKSAMYARMGKECEAGYAAARRDPDGEKLDYPLEIHLKKGKGRANPDETDEDIDENIDVDIGED